MNKKVLKVLLLCMTFLLSFSSLNLLASAETNENQVLAPEGIEQGDLIPFNFDEYSELMAKSKGISNEEARTQLLDSLRDTYGGGSNKARSQRLSDDEIIAIAAEGTYQFTGQSIQVDNGKGVFCKLEYGVLVTVAGSGSFRYITSVVPGTTFVLVTSSGTSSYQPGYATALFIDQNTVQFRSTGVVQVVVSQNDGGAFSLKGFSFSGSSGTNYTYRKTVDLNTAFRLNK